MGLTYGVQLAKDLLGSIASPVTLTAAYAGNTAIFSSPEMSELTVYVEYTPGAGGAGNSIQVKLEGSPDDVDVSQTFYQDVMTTSSGGVSELEVNEYSFEGAVALTSYKFRVLYPTADVATRLSIKETIVGGAAGTASVRIVKSGRLA